MRFAVNFLRNEEEAKDIVQDVFEKLWMNREKVELGKIKLGYSPVRIMQC